MLRIAIGALIGAAFAANAAAADLTDLKAAYVAGAFGDADSNWSRAVAQRYTVCGKFGSNDTRRVDLLVDRYQALGEALESGDDASAMAAARRLASGIEANSRFGECWSRIAKREGVSRDFTKLISEF